MLASVAARPKHRCRIAVIIRHCKIKQIKSKILAPQRIGGTVLLIYYIAGMYAAEDATAKHPYKTTPEDKIEASH